MQHIPDRVLKNEWQTEVAHLPREYQRLHIAGRQGLKQIQRLVQEGREDELNKIIGTTVSYKDITDTIQTIINKSEQHPEKPGINQQLQQIKEQTPVTQLKVLKSIAFDLSDTLQRKSKEFLTKTDKENFHHWFQATMRCMLKTDTIEQPSYSKLPVIAEATLQLFQIIIDRQLADPDLVPYVLLAKTLGKLYTLSINQSVSGETRAKLTTVIASLCDSFENSDIARTPAFIGLREQSLVIHLKSLNPAGVNIPSSKSIEILTDLIEITPTPENIFLLIKILVNFYGLVDFGDEEQVRQQIKKITASDVSDALMAYLDGNIAEIVALDSQNSMVIWLKAMIALNHQFDPEKSERLLIDAASNDDRMHFELARFYLEHCHSPDFEKLATIKSLLEKSESRLHGAERPLWLQCKAKVNQLIFLKEESQITPSSNNALQDAPPDKNDRIELIKAKPLATPAVETNQVPLTDLSSVMSLAKALIKKYQYHHDANSADSDAIKEFSVIGWKGKKLNPFAAMKPENRNPVINKLLRHIHTCRIFNNLEEEVRCYDILKNQKFMFMLQFERLLEEATWTLLHCTEDPHSGGLRSTQQERLDALNLARQMMILCLQHTVKQTEIVDGEQRVNDSIASLTDWLDNINNFGGDKELQQSMRHNIRCRAGSGLGHIFQFIQEETGRSEMANMASLCFQAKTTFDPCYKPECKGLKENRAQYYRRVTLYR
ncbi:hypothetical protein [Endozoicomonas sp. GU-1]|nr:hypothetical protein [Endozoicomonas sp. GU-1]WBA80332.1 hypothetical protein O2T12_18600 [Endozoicomonas sp. GU-1]